MIITTTTMLARKRNLARIASFAQCFDGSTESGRSWGFEKYFEFTSESIKMVS